MTRPGEFTASRPDRKLPDSTLRRIRADWQDGVPLSVMSERYRMRPERVKKLCAELPRGDVTSSRWL